MGKSPNLKLDVEDILREARKAEDARFPRIKSPIEDPPPQAPLSRGQATTVVNSMTTENTHCDMQLMESVWPQTLRHADPPPPTDAKATGSIDMVTHMQPSTTTESGSSISTHYEDPTGVMTLDFPTSLSSSSADWAQLSCMANLTSGSDHFGFYAEGLYGEDGNRAFTEQGILGTGSYIESWMGN